MRNFCSIKLSARWASEEWEGLGDRGTPSPGMHCVGPLGLKKPLAAHSGPRSIGSIDCCINPWGCGPGGARGFPSRCNRHPREAPRR